MNIAFPFYTFLVIILALAQQSGSAQQVVTPLNLALDLSTIAEGDISLPGQEDRFALQLAPGQRLLFDSLDDDAESIYVRLVAPSGKILMESGYDGPPFYALEDGTYSLVVFAGGDTTGDYRFQMLDLDHAEEMFLGVPVVGQLDPPLETFACQIQAIAGQRLAFESLSASHTLANWSLVGPAGQEILVASITDDLGEVTLPVSGRYLVLVRGLPPADQPLDFSIAATLVSDPAGESSGFGVVRSGTINPGEAIAFPYTAPAGTLVYLDALGSDASWLWADLRAPDGNSVLSAWALSDAGPAVLPLSGNYLLELRATEAFSPATYSFRLLDLGTSEVLTPDGGISSGTINPPDLTLTYRFHGLPGQRLHLDFVDTAPGTVHPQFVGPSGQELYPTIFWSDQDRQLLITEPGTHHLLLRTSAGFPIDYQFRVIDLAAPPTNLLLPDEPAQGVVRRSWQTELFRLDGRAGQRLFFDFRQLAGDATWQLVSPGNEILNAWNPSGDLELTLPETGLYAMAISSGDGSPSPYRFEVVAANTSTLPLQLGSPVQHTLSTPGEKVTFTFQGTIGQQLFFDGLDAEVLNLLTRLVGPNGATLFQLENPNADFGPLALNLTGTYRLEVGGATDNLGEFGFRLLDCSQPPVSPLLLDQPVVGTLDPRAEVDIYRFDGHSAERLFVDSLDEMANCSWALYSPNLEPIAASSLNGDIAVVLPQTGNYLMSVSGSPAAPGAYTFVVRRPDTVKAPLTLGVSVFGSLSQPGVEHRYTFTGTVGMQIYHDALIADSDNVPLTLLGPDSQMIGSMTAAADYGPIQLAQSGTYTIVLGGMNDTLGDYRFRLLDLASATPLPNELPGQLNPPDETDLLRFDGQSGQRLLLEQLESVSDQAAWRLVSPSGQTLAQNSMLTSFSELVLRESGAYYVLIEGYRDATSPLNYHIRRTITEPSGTPSGLGVLHSGSIDVAETHVFNFTAPAGTMAYFDSLIMPSPGLEMELFHTDGSVVVSGDPTWDSGPWWLPESGDYTLAIRGNSSASTGDYRFRLLDLATDSIPIVMGEVMNESPLEPFEARAFHFMGATGQQVYYDALAQSPLGNSTLLALGPDGYQQFLHGAATSDYGPWTLVLPGKHILLIDHGGADALSATFRLVDLLEEPIGILALGESVDAQLDPPQITHFYRVPITGGPRLFFRGSEGSWDLLWVLYTLDFTSNVGGYVGDNYEFDWLKPDGDCLLVVRQVHTESQAPVPYSLALQVAASDSSPLQFDTSVNGSLPLAGSEHRFTFHGTAGQIIYYDALEHRSSPVDLALISPAGVRLLYGSAGTDNGPILLTTPGNYTLVLDSLSFDPQSYGFRVLDGSTQPPVVLDTPTQTTLEGYHARLHPIESMAGLRLLLDSLSVDYHDGHWDLHAPDASWLAGVNLASDFQATPSYPGVHWLVLNNQEPEPVAHSFRIVPGNHAPTLSVIPDLEIDELSPFELELSASDLEQPNDTLTFAFAAEAPAGASLDPSSGLLQWTPAENQGPGEYQITARVADDGVPSLSDTTTFRVLVREVNRAPIIEEPANPTIHAGASLQLSIVASDPDIPFNAVTFSLLQAPPDATIEAVSGEFRWLSSSTDASQIFPVEVQVSDDGIPAMTATATFQITVAGPLRIETVQRTDNGLELRWRGIAGHSYRIESMNRLDSTWLDLGVDIPGSSDVTTALVPFAEDVFAQYYRLRETP